MKIAVYTIALNEIHEVDGWAAANQEADHRVVVDTGSTDGTADALREKGVTVFDAAIIPWRFDDAFNTALALVPRDVDVCFRLDMDERPRPGWRQAIETEFDETATLLRYPYYWSRQISFYCDRIHRRRGYRWKGPTHEGLVWRGEGHEHHKFIETVTVDHFQKPRTRPNDMALLREACREYPDDSRLLLYFARELAWHKQDDEAQAALRRFQQLSNYPNDLAYSYRLLAGVDRANQLAHLETAKRFDPNASADLELATYWYEQDWPLCYQHITECLNKLQEIGNWTDDLRLKTAYPYDIACIAAWNMGEIGAAHRYAQEAAKRNPEDQRLATNVLLLQHAVSQLE